MSDNDYIINNAIGFSIVGIIIKFFFSGKTTSDGSSGPANSSIWGYGLISLSIFMTMFLLFALSSKTSNNLSLGLFPFIKNLLTDSLPSLLTLLILTWIIYLNILFYKRINQGKVSNEYSRFSLISTFILVIQVIVLLQFLREKTSINAKPESYNKLSYAVYGLTFISVIFVGLMNIILAFFSTDG